MSLKYKNGGFPPIVYCPELDSQNKSNPLIVKERLFSTTPKQQINIKQLLEEKKVAVIDLQQYNELEIVNN